MRESSIMGRIGLELCLIFPGKNIECSSTSLFFSILCLKTAQNIKASTEAHSWYTYCFLFIKLNLLTLLSKNFQVHAKITICGHILQKSSIKAHSKQKQLTIKRLMGKYAYQLKGPVYQLQLNKQTSQKMNFCHQFIYDDMKTENEASGYTNIAGQKAQEGSAQKSAAKLHQHAKRKYQKDNIYNWNSTQNRRYINFLAKQGHLLCLSTSDKKKQKVNVLMSKAIKSRTSTQCHTHHQKMTSKYGSIENIISEHSYILGKSKGISLKEIVPIKVQQENNQAIEIVETEQTPKQSIWKQYLLPEIFSCQEDFCDYLYTF